MTRNMKIILLSAISFVIIVVGVLGFIGNYFYNISINPKTERPFFDNNPDLSLAERQRSNGWSRLRIPM